MKRERQKDHVKEVTREVEVGMMRPTDKERGKPIEAKKGSDRFSPKALGHLDFSLLRPI